MKTAMRVPLAYLALSSVCLIPGNWVTGNPFVDGSLALLAKEVIFVALSTIGLYFILRHEQQRRDAVEDHLRFRAIHDPLTGLLNRACFAENLERSIARAARERGTVGVAFIDMDGFKQVNDRCGHHVGDQLLVEVGHRIRRVIRQADCASRHGGDEFVVMFEGESAEGARRLAERLRSALAAPIVIDGQSLSGVSASVGVALYPDHGQRGEHLLRAADAAMYQAKESGKNMTTMALQSLA